MQLATLGGLSLEGYVVQRRKPLLLLTYLALAGPRSRRELGELFFPESGDPRDALSTTLRRLHQLDAGLVTLEGDRVATEVPCDANLLLEALAAHDVEGAVRLYRGRFLAGVDLRLSEELEEWVYLTRERLASAYRAALLTAGLEALQGEDRARARSLCETAWRLSEAPDPEGDELRDLFEVLTATGSPLAREARAEADAQGLELPVAGASGRTPPETTAVTAYLPTPATSFVGRQEELAELLALLGDGSCRLVTVHGPGGIGKSRLALQAARDLLDAGAAPDGAYAVALETLTNTAQLPAAIATAMRLPLTPPTPPVQALKAAIGTRDLLLVLDNYEHLLPDTSLVRELLDGCPHLRMVVTSRVVLRLHDEHVVPLDGLPTHAATNDPTPAALRLFLARARQAHRRPVDDVGGARRVCAALEGHPLAIELAASWTRTLDLEEIVQELARGTGLLTSDVTDRPERHRDLDAVFEHSWQLLGPELRTALMRLGVFVGGFTREDAVRVADATLGDLRALVNASFLRRSAGRFEGHPLVHVFVRGKLAADPELERAARARHGHTFLSLLEGLEVDILGGDAAPAALATLTREFANVRAAWRWALEARACDLVRTGSWTLVQYGELTGYYDRAAELLTQAVRELDPERRAERRAWASALATRAFLSFRMNDFASAVADGERAHEALAEFEEPTGNWGRWIALQSAGVASVFTGDLDDAEAFVRRAMQCALDDRAAARSPLDAKRADVTAGISRRVMGFIATQRGAFADAAEHLSASSDLLRPHQSPYLGYALWNLGQVQVGMGQVMASISSLLEAHTYARALGFRALVGLIAVDLAKAHFEHGDVERAHEWCGAALAEAAVLGDTRMRLSALAVVGKLHSARSQHDRALACFGESFRSALDIGAFTFGVEALIGAADALARTGDVLGAAEALGFVTAHPLTPAPGRLQAEHELAQLAALHGQSAVGEAAELGRRREGTEVAERVFGPARAQEH